MLIIVQKNKDNDKNATLLFYFIGKSPKNQPRVSKFTISKFVPRFHFCEKKGHVLPKCFKLKVQVKNYVQKLNALFNSSLNKLLSVKFVWKQKKVLNLLLLIFHCLHSKIMFGILIVVALGTWQEINHFFRTSNLVKRIMSHMVMVNEERF